MRSARFAADAGWELTGGARRTLHAGVSSYDISLEKQEVLVKGTIAFEPLREKIAKTGKEVAYAGDIFVSDAVNVPIEGPCVRERWTRSKEFEKVRGKQVCSRHCV